MKPKLRIVIIGLLFVLLALTEHCTGPLWWECNPPYLLCAVTVCAMFCGEKVASLFGLVAGLFADSMTSGVFGLRAVLYLVLGYLIAFFAEKVLSRNIFTCILTGILSVALNELAFWGVVSLKHTIPLATAAQYVFLPRLTMCLPVLIVLYFLFFLFYREREVYPTRRRR